MTSLSRWRRIARSLVLISFTWEAAATLVSLALLGIVAIQGGAVPADRLIAAVASLGLLGVVLWAVCWDARSRRLRLAPQPVVVPARKARPSGNGRG